MHEPEKKNRIALYVYIRKRLDIATVYPGSAKIRRENMNGRVCRKFGNA